MNIESIFNDWISSKSTVLDLGCGDGKILSSLQKKKNITGIVIGKAYYSGTINLEEAIKVSKNA